MRAATRACGYGLQERLAVYPRYLHRPERFFTASIAARIAGIARADGLARQQCL
ncbi:hypothetical protein [Marinobacterium aestuariivivens]|uniref:Uncharacterized protein n=1 Tax=Marinobacterium aestuariivivens TaxID=1698799 RepID=A0ABW1ZXJ8_9GAMM